DVKVGALPEGRGGEGGDIRKLAVQRVADCVQCMTAGIGETPQRHGHRTADEGHVAAEGELSGHIAVAEIRTEARAVELDACGVDELICPVTAAPRGSANAQVYLRILCVEAKRIEAIVEVALVQLKGDAEL